MNELPVVFAPGLNCTPALFAGQVAALTGRAIHYVDHTRDDSVEQIAARFLRHAPSRFALAGLSMGGYIAFEILRQAPERVDRLALLDTRASPDTPDDRQRRERLIQFAETGRFNEVHGVLWQRLVHPSRLSDKALEATVKGMMADTGAEAFVRQQRAVITRADYRADLAAITAPTLVLVGDQDQITPPEHAKAMADHIPGSTLTIVEACGHLSTLEQPATVNHAFQHWLV